MFMPAKNQKRNGVDRAGRKFQILTYLWERRYKRSASGAVGNMWVTTYEIARAIGMKPTKHLRTILEELYQEGVILNQQELHRLNQYKMIWACADNARWAEPYKGWFDSYFQIEIEMMGMQQLELPGMVEVGSIRGAK